LAAFSKAFNLKCDALTGESKSLFFSFGETDVVGKSRHGDGKTTLWFGT